MIEQPVETTVYSLSDAPPSDCGERRDSERHLTLFRVGSLTVNGERELCLIKNISAGGMMVRAYRELPTDALISIELKSSQTVNGRVSWVRDDHAGIAFETPIDIVDILSNSEKGPRPRMPRIEVDTFITLRHESHLFSVHVTDVSQGGFKAVGDCALNPGDQVVAKLPGLAPEPGTVRWSADRQLGISFNRTIPLPTLIAWIRDLRDGFRRAG